MDLERTLINRYLLGTATDAEDEEIGVRIIEDASFAEALVQAENDLIEDYLEGSLSAAEQELFEKQYLVSDERRERMQEIALLKKYATRSAEMAAIVDPPVETRPWWRSLRILVPAFGLVALLAIAGFLLLDRDSVGGIDYAQLNRQDLRDAAVIGDSQIVQITPGILRSATPPSVSVVSGTSASVLFRLPLSFAVDAGRTFDASVERDGKKLFSVNRARVYTDGALTEVKLLVPREVLRSGTNQIRLIQNETSNAPVIYTFEVR
jgi:hypothetical protein